MFDKNAPCSENMLRYRLTSYEKVDEFALNVLKSGAVTGVIIPGFSGKEILIPLSGLTPLEEYLKTNSTIVKTGDIIRQYIEIRNSVENHMLGESSLICRAVFSYISEDDKLVMVCVPASRAVAEAGDEREYIREIIGCGIYNEKDAQQVISILSYINGEGFSPEGLVKYIDELCGGEEELYGRGALGRCELSGSKLSCCETSESNKSSGEKLGDEKQDDEDASCINDLPPVKYSFGYKMAGAIRKIFYSDQAITMTDEDLFTKGVNTYMEELPPGVSVIAVRKSGEEYPLGYGPDIIGTDKTRCSICFPENERMAKTHCRVYFDKGRYCVEDLGAKPGTLLNGVALIPFRPKPLSSADHIDVCGEQLIFSKRS